MKANSHGKWMLFLFLTTFSLWLSGYVQREIHVFRQNNYEEHTDFNVYYTAGVVAKSNTDRQLYSLQETQDPKDKSKSIVINPQLQPPNPASTYGYFDHESNSGQQYLYPPFFAMVVEPLTLLGYEKSRVLWHILILAAAGVSIVFTVRLFNKDNLETALISGVILVFAEFIFPMQDILSVGNVGSFVMMLCAAGILTHKWSPALGSLFFALAVMIKLTPVVVVPVMLVRKQWTWLYAFCSWIVLLLGLSIWKLGWQNHLEFVSRVLPSMSDGIPVITNRSLSTLYYAISSGKFLSMAQVLHGDYFSPSPIPILVFKLTAVVTFCLLLWFFRTNTRSASQICLEILIVILWSIIFSPISFRHYFVLALPPIIFAWLHPLTREFSVFRLTMLSAATVMIFSGLPNYGLLLNDSFVLQLILFSVMPAGVMICILYLAMLLKSQVAKGASYTEC